MNQTILTFYSSLYFSLQEILFTLVIAWGRIAPVLFFLPFLSNKLLNNGIIKNCITIYFILGLWPTISEHKMQWEIVTVIESLLYELVIGIVISLMLALPFMIANIIVEIIDTQRGETISSIIDPTIGTEASQFSVFISYIICVVFLSQDGLLVLVNIFYKSYQLLPFAVGFSQFNSLLLGEWINQMVIKGIILAIPILITLFISEVALGLYSRFCPQLNTFSLSLSIKSISAFIVFLLYFKNEVPVILINMIYLTPLYNIFILPNVFL
ncbi:type III secretion system export apparatus subunit SctT [Providencia sneebia]|uniref:Type III secretion system protein BsaY n=1 Tax=Providencia sneebia DSM 19967 TaxID=1141660 RepID=K8WJY0_9GAMM|nr:type III secretion system export apparatus subunit SctT [Providencia sneebia]EKT60898.1 type III secretion system protein BsaY [Providencia sneebia DSM 19967]